MLHHWMVAEVSTLTIVRGMSGSGKTRFARRRVASALQPEYELMCRVNRDDIRAMLHDGTYIHGITEEVVIAVRDATIRAALRKGWDVISDDTNLRSRNVRDLMKVAASVGAEVKFEDFTDVPLEECIRRDNWRARNDEPSVGEDVILDQYNRFLKGRKLPLPVPASDEPPTFDPISRGTIPAIIVDIDGTTAHNNGHRGWYEYDKVAYDEPNRNVIDVVSAMDAGYHEVIFVSGRSDQCRDLTAEWLGRHVISSYWDNVGDDVANMKHPNDNQSGLYKLFMRPEGDYRDDALVKYELYRDYIAPFYDVRVVLDDRDRMVRMWREIGLTCLQVAEGDF